MTSPIVYRKWNLEDLSNVQISEGLSATAESIEFNVLGIGHEFWIAVEGDRIVGLTVLGRAGPKEFKVMYLQVPALHEPRSRHWLDSSYLRAFSGKRIFSHTFRRN